MTQAKPLYIANDALSPTWYANPATKLLINDYAKYHMVLVIVGGLLTVGLLVLGIFGWRQFRRVPKIGQKRWNFEQRVYLSFAFIGWSVGLLMAAIVAINAVTAFSPSKGFSSLINAQSIVNSPTGQQLTAWEQSNSATVPAAFQAKIDQRLAWQRPKALACGVLFVFFSGVNWILWKKVIVMRRGDKSRWSPNQILIFVAGMLAIPVSLLLMIMFVANLQAVIAPAALTILGIGGS